MEPPSNANAPDHITPESDKSVTGDEEEKLDEGNDDEWIPPPKQTASKNGGRRVSDASKKSRKPKPSGKGHGHVSKLEEDMKDLTLQDNIGADDSVIIVPAKSRSKKNDGDVDEDSDEIRPAGVKKKKR